MSYRLLLSLPILLLDPHLAFSQEVDSRLISLAFERGEAERRVLLKDTQEEMDDAKESLSYEKSPQYRTDLDRSAQDQRAAIARTQLKIEELERRLTSLKDTDSPIIPDVIGEIDVGEIGLWRYTTTVRQKISDREALLDVKVNQDSRRTYLVYAQGYDFSTVVDGRAYAFTGPVVCLETTTYTTALGTSKTVPLVKSMNLAEAAAKEKARRKNERRRTWSDATGAFSVSAILLSYENGKATLEREDGTTITVPIGKLSKSDQDIVRKQFAKSKAKD